MCLLVALAVAVFCWGLQYKLSLYKAPDRVSALSLTAKLSDRESEGLTIAPEQATDFPVAMIADFVLVLAVLSTSLIGSSRRHSWTRAMDLPISFRLHRGLPAFAFRPPPSIS